MEIERFVTLQHDCLIEQCLLHIRLLWENEQSVFWSFHPLADKPNNEHLPEPFLRSYEHRSNKMNKTAITEPL